MKWPRGKHNGLRIVGVVVTIHVNVRDWGLGLSLLRRTLRMFVGPVHIWIDPNYEDGWE